MTMKKSNIDFLGKIWYPWFTAAKLCSRRYVILGENNIRLGLRVKRAGSGCNRLTCGADNLCSRGYVILGGDIENLACERIEQALAAAD